MEDLTRYREIIHDLLEEYHSFLTEHRIEEDCTKEGIADELICKRVPACDIVRAFNPPELRGALPAFAAA